MNSSQKSKEELDQKIIAIQRSTRTALPFFIPFHNLLRSRFKWYYQWHLQPANTFVHVGFLLLYLIGIMILMRSVFWFFGF